MSERRWWTRLRIGGTQVEVVGDVTQQEQLEGQETFAATARVAGTPAITTGSTADICLADLEAGSAVFQMAGQVDEVRGISIPHQQTVVVTGVLAKLRKARTADLDMSGMTDGAAVQNALTFAGVSFTATDIQDAGYTLGSKKPVTWLKNVTAAEFIAELDRVFQMKTLEVGNGRVVRVRYDLVPSTANAVKTFERGTSLIFFGNERSRGKFDDIRNVVDVRGVSYECGDDKACTCTVWAHAEADHAKLGVGVRAKPVEVSSELIQTTGLAEAIARDVMRRRNRETDRVRVGTENDPNVTVGKIIAVRDQAAGVDLSTATPYQVVSIDRRGNRMTVDGIGGAAGAVGTLTSGIDQVCQDLSFNIPELPNFSMPGISFPPFVAPDLAFPSLPAMPGLGEFSPPDNEIPNGTVPLGGTCGVDADCQAGLACIGGTCQKPCTTSADCGPDQVCASGSCADIGTGYTYSAFLGEYWVQTSESVNWNGEPITVTGGGAAHHTAVKFSGDRPWIVRANLKTYAGSQIEMGTGACNGTRQFAVALYEDGRLELNSPSNYTIFPTGMDGRNACFVELKMDYGAGLLTVNYNNAPSFGTISGTKSHAETFKPTGDRCVGIKGYGAAGTPTGEVGDIELVVF